MTLADLEPDEGHGGPGIMVPRAGGCRGYSEDAEVPVLARWHDARAGPMAAAGRRYQSDSHARPPGLRALKTPMPPHCRGRST